MISENVSEKPKRGRPRTISHKEVEENAIALGIASHSERDKIEAYYRTVAMTAILNDSREYPWLYDKKAPEGKEAWRRTILSHLGRLSDFDEIRQAAAFINGNQLSTKDAIRTLRKYRGVTNRVPSRNDLEVRLLKVLGDYWKCFPELKPEFFITAMESVTDGLYCDQEEQSQ